MKNVSTFFFQQTTIYRLIFGSFERNHKIETFTKWEENVGKMKSAQRGDERSISLQKNSFSIFCTQSILLSSLFWYVSSMSYIPKNIWKKNR